MNEAPTAQHPWRVLVADHDAAVRSFLGMILTDKGYSVRVHECLQHAAQLCRSHQVDLLMVDRDLLESSQLDVATCVAWADDEAAVVIVDAHATMRAAVSAMQLGVADYLAKPFDPEDLMARLERVIVALQIKRDNRRLVEDLRRKNVRLQEAVEQLSTKEQQLNDSHLRLHEATIQLIQAEKMAALGQLGAGITHEIKNPMTGIIGFAQFGREAADNPDKARHLFVIIEEQAQRCKDILANFLKYARGSPGEMTRLDINQVVGDAVQIFGHQLGLHDVAVSTRLGDGLPPVVGNAGELQQVLLNLAMNAQQAMRGGGEVKLTTRCDDGCTLVIEVEDNGPGVPETAQRQIFEPFFTTKSDREGTGLGLAISAEIVRKHNGSISVQSTTGQGTTFLISLPAADKACTTGSAGDRSDQGQ
jgi:signal transduction histidine kinase